MFFLSLTRSYKERAVSNGERQEREQLMSKGISSPSLQKLSILLLKEQKKERERKQKIHQTCGQGADPENELSLLYFIISIRPLCLLMPPWELETSLLCKVALCVIHAPLEGYHDCTLQPPIQQTSLSAGTSQTKKLLPFSTKDFYRSPNYLAHGNFTPPTSVLQSLHWRTGYFTEKSLPTEILVHFLCSLFKMLLWHLTAYSFRTLDFNDIKKHWASCHYITNMSLRAKPMRAKFHKD